MSGNKSHPTAPRFPLSAWIGSALPLAMVWVVLYLTGAVSTGVLTAIGIAIVVLVLWVGTGAKMRMRRGR
ncbi:hypothetical protein ACWC0C_41360 [Streptomyces sp. NPDC001709]